jgi:hypothetical protein
VKHLPDYNDKFPKWPPQNMAAYASKSFNEKVVHFHITVAVHSCCTTAAEIATY